jgi:hypothetical protein
MNLLRRVTSFLVIVWFLGQPTYLGVLVWYISETMHEVRMARASVTDQAARLAEVEWAFSYILGESLECRGEP